LIQTLSRAQSEPEPIVASSCDGSAVQKATWTSYYSGTRVWGYVDKHSVSAGESFSLMFSTVPGLKELTGRIEVFRIGYYAETDRKLVFTDEHVEVPHFDLQMTAASLGAGWPPADDVETVGWESGYYTIDFIDDSDGQRDLNVAYIVVTNADKSGDIL